MKISVSTYFLVTILYCFLNLPVFPQQTERTPFAFEFPELNTGQITEPKSYVSRTDVNVVKFWILNPDADAIEWSKIKVRINRQSANIACSQNAASAGKVLRCDLNRIAGFRLQAKENFFEIEAVSRDAKRFYGSFIVITNAAAAVKQTEAKIKTGSAQNGENSPATTKGSSQMGFSGRKFAVVIGVSEYQYNDIGLNNLSYADKDAEALNDWMTRAGGFNPQNILYLTNKNATLSAVRDSLNRFLSKATETDLVLFFLAGHGTPDPFNPRELYFLVYDSKVADLKNTGFPMTELKQIIDTKLKSKRAIFLLDTCHSAGVSGRKIVVAPRDNKAAGKTGKNEREIGERKLEREVEVRNDINEASARLFSSSGRAILTSSDINETSRESESWGGGHGVFTWALLNGLRGNADLNFDKIISTDELFTFVRQTVRAETNEKQNPRLFSNLSSSLEMAVIK
ncbi:MAG TPA: caspase family protein [Pyrinomonadaceae bacterium]